LYPIEIKHKAVRVDIDRLKASGAVNVSLARYGRNNVPFRGIVRKNISASWRVGLVAHSAEKRQPVDLIVRPNFKARLFRQEILRGAGAGTPKVAMVRVQSWIVGAIAGYRPRGSTLRTKVLRMQPELKREKKRSANQANKESN
jgi:hypothetical protein